MDELVIAEDADPGVRGTAQLMMRKSKSKDCIVGSGNDAEGGCPSLSAS